MFPEVPGEALPQGCWRLKQAASTRVRHHKEYDNADGQLRDGQVESMIMSPSARVLPGKANLVETKQKNDDGEEVEGPSVVQ